MPIFRTEVEGEPVRVIALPKWTPKALAAWERFVESDPIFGLDTEATSAEDLGVFDPAIKTRLIQFGNRTEAWVLDPKHPKWRKRIASLLMKEAQRFVAHNTGYDESRVLDEFDILLGERMIDTKPMADLIWPGITKAKGLKPLSDELIDNGLSDAEHDLHALFVDLYFANKPRKTALLPKSFVPGESRCRRAKCTEPSWVGSRVGYCHEHYMARKPDANAHRYGWSNVPLTAREYLLYAGLDTIYVRRLLDILTVEIKRAKMSRLSRTEQRVNRLMTGVSRRGMRVDVEWTAEILAEVGRDFADAEDRVMMETGLKARSPKMIQWLAEERGIRTKSLDKDHLPKLIEKYPDEPVLLDLREVSSNSNLLSNLRTIMKHATEGDGYVHPNINPQQAHTGRMSATKPAVQTLAKKGLKGERLRGCFIADDGWIFIGADYDSQEIRIAAALSRDPMLLKIVLEGLNQHVLTAQSIFPDYTTKEECPAQYGSAKTLDFAQQYGAFPKKIAETLTRSGIPTTVAEATVMWQKWRHTYAGLVQWSEELGRQRQIVNPFGRVIPRDPYRDYANANYMIQSTGRDFLGQALLGLEDAGWGQNIWLPIHDEIVMHVPEHLAEKGCKAMTEIMSTSLRGVEIPAEGEIIGTRWKGLG